MDENQTPLAAMLESINIAESLDEAQLRKIGHDAFAGYDLDEQSRQDWVKHVDEWTKLAKQTVEPKTYPWVGAANVKYPLLSTAAMQFAARAYPSLVPSNGKIAIRLDEGDSLVDVNLCNHDDHVLISTKNGKSIRFAVSGFCNR